MFSKFKFAVLFILIINLAGCSYFRKDISQASPGIRVLLDEGTFFRIRTAGLYEFQSGYEKTPGKGAFIVSVLSNHLEINGTPVSSEEILFFSSTPFQLNGKYYRGNLRIKLNKTELLLINELNIEDYLLSVVPSEVPNSWQNEALKAQSIVARSYALFELQNSRKLEKPFDVYASTRSQVYKGMDVENKYTSDAVRSTLGEIVTWKGKTAKTYFHACSGGMTESSKDAFNDPRPYLKVIPSPYGKIYSLFHWSTNLPARKIENLFQDLFQGHLKGIAVSSRTASKRIQTVTLIDSAGIQHRVSGSEFRKRIGATVMRSTRANIQTSDGKIILSGVGYGHGVGLAQWDAQEMALKHKTYRQIIAFFYPGTDIRKIW